MVSIEPVSFDELPALAALYEELIDSKTNLDKMAESFRWMQSNPDYILLGAKDDNGLLVGSLLGVVCHDIIGECRPFMVIDNVIVKSDCRGLGIGRQLMHHIEEIVRARDCHYIMFVSASNRKEAHKFYGSVDYSLDAVRGFKKYL